MELNVLAQMRVLRMLPQVARAMDGSGLTIHGLVYDRSKNEAVRLQVDMEMEQATQR